VPTKQKSGKTGFARGSTADGSGSAGKSEEDTRPRIRVKIRAYDHKIIDQAASTIMKTVERSGAKVLGPVPLPTERRRYTVNRSTFVHKNSREQYEMRVHKRLIDIIEPTEKTMDAMQSLNLPAGVDVEIKML
jgi:small subunit ribosomal protein S10